LIYFFLNFLFGFETPAGPVLTRRRLSTAIDADYLSSKKITRFLVFVLFCFVLGAFPTLPPFFIFAFAAIRYATVEFGFFSVVLFVFLLLFTFSTDPQGFSSFFVSRVP